LKVNDENSRIRIQDPDPNPDPDPLGMGPRIRIHTKMSWIRNTGLEDPPRHQMETDNFILPISLAIFMGEQLIFFHESVQISLIFSAFSPLGVNAILSLLQRAATAAKRGGLPT
jgi:hypothetical protein